MMPQNYRPGLDVVRLAALLPVLCYHYCIEAARLGFPGLELDVWSFNEDAQRFYESAGFRTYRSFLELPL